jgi:hypothetical protein
MRNELQSLERLRLHVPTMRRDHNAMPMTPTGALS